LKEGITKSLVGKSESWTCENEKYVISDLLFRLVEHSEKDLLPKEIVPQNISLLTKIVPKNLRIGESLEQQESLSDNEHNVVSPLFDLNNKNIPYSEYLALKDLYDSTYGSRWSYTFADSQYFAGIGLPWHFPSNSTSTIFPNPCSEKWHGIVCSLFNGLNHVYVIDLEFVNMDGTIPPSIGNFSMVNS
jgi:hypothetical protein